MAQFTYNDYQNTLNAAQSNSSAKNTTKIGFFKLGKDQTALVRLNCTSIDDLHFATIHRPQFGKKYEGLANPYAGISCKNPIGSYDDNCPLCQAAANGHPVVDKATKKVYITMLVSYKDPATGNFSAPEAVVWERPASYSREIATKLQTYGDLTQNLFLMTRTGEGTDTRYSLDYAPPMVFKPELIPADFSAFANYNPAHSCYWEKSVEEINTFLTTGKFPETATKTAPAKSEFVAAAEPDPAPVATDLPWASAPSENYNPTYQPKQTPATAAYTTPATPAPTAEPAAPVNQRPVRSFTDYKF